MAKRGGKMKEWKDIKIPASLFEEIKELVKVNENYNSVSDFARIASMKELERLGREVL
jgi:Arc/MetJ-type ribon-helix-helix transcriptional regulator